MKACMESAADGAARTTCKDTTAKAALATALGRQTSDITPTELNKFMADAGKEQVREEMKACMESASDGAARTTCKATTAKAALAIALGKQTSDISATELNKFVNDAGKAQVGQEMKACMESASDAAARTACKATTAKAALATSLGKQISDITPTELNKFVNDAGKEQVCIYLIVTCSCIYLFIATGEGHRESLHGKCSRWHCKDSMQRHNREGCPSKHPRQTGI